MAFMLSFCAISYGQIEAGKIYTMGGIGFGSSSETTESGGNSYDGPKLNGFNLDLGGGYMITNNIGAGVMIGTSNDKQDYSDDVATLI